MVAHACHRKELQSESKSIFFCNNFYFIDQLSLFFIYFFVFYFYFFFISFLFIFFRIIFILLISYLYFLSLYFYFFFFLFIPWDACGTPTVKNRFGCTQNCKASQQDCVKSLSIISSSKSTNGIVQNLYRFLIDLLPLRNV